MFRTAVWPMSDRTRPSLLPWVLRKRLLKIQNTSAATASPPRAASGPLIKGFRVAGILWKTMPSPPKAVINAASVVGLNGEKPGISWSAKPPSAWEWEIWPA